MLGDSVSAPWYPTTIILSVFLSVPQFLFAFTVYPEGAMLCVLILYPMGVLWGSNQGERLASLPIVVQVGLLKG